MGSSASSSLALSVEGILSSSRQAASRSQASSISSIASADGILRSSSGLSAASVSVKTRCGSSSVASLSVNNGNEGKDDGSKEDGSHFEMITGWSLRQSSVEKIGRAHV